MKRTLPVALCASVAAIFAAILANDILSGPMPPGKLFLYLLFAAGWTLIVALLNRFLPAAPVRFLVALALISGAVRVGWIAAVPNRQVSDFAVYQELSASVASGKGYVLTGPAGREDLELYIGSRPLPYRTAWRPPGTPFWGSVLRLLFGPGPVVFKIANVLLGIGISVLLYLLLAGAGRPVPGRIAAILWALYPSAIAATSLFCSEILFTFFLLLTAFLFARSAGPRPAKVVLALSGLAAAAAVLVRPVLPVLIASAAIAAGFSKKGLRRMLVFALFLALGILPWTLRNTLRFHSFIPVCANEGAILGRHSIYLVPANIKSSAAWKERYARFCSLDSEGERSAGGYRFGLYNLGMMVSGGCRHTAGCVWRTVRTVFGTDNDMLLWSVRNSWGTVQNGLPPFSVPPGAIVFLKLLNGSFYFAAVLIAVRGAFAADRAAASEGIALLFWCFVLFFVSHAVIPGIDRYHFALMPVMLILVALNPAWDRIGALFDKPRQL